MTDYKTAYEALAAAAKRVLRMWDTDEDVNGSLLALERALDQVPAAAEERIQFHKDGAYVKVELTKSDNAAVENIQDDAAEPTWRETCTAPIQWDLMSPEAKGATPDPDAAEREHIASGEAAK